MSKVNNEEGKKKCEPAFRISYLVAGYLRQTLTVAEERELDIWIAASDDNEQLFGQLTDDKHIASTLAQFDKWDTETALASVKSKINFRKPGISRRFWQYAVAASLLLALATGIFLLLTRKRGADESLRAGNDLRAGTDSAFLTTSKGQTFNLASPFDTTLSGSVHLKGETGMLVYQGAAVVNEPEIHTISVPRKGKYRLVLPDGTKVWLNAESSISFPLAFTPGERKVQVSGETYFEVAKDASRPFRVVSGDFTTEATGTQFNVNAYPNEQVIRTTLVEGGVNVFAPGAKIALMPGEQATYRYRDIQKSVADISAVTAWKEDVFKFRNQDLPAIMRQVERWYDADVVFIDNISERFNATVDRSLPVSKLLEYLAMTEHVSFTVKGKSIEVRRKK